MAILGCEGFDHYLTDTAGGTIDEELPLTDDYSVESLNTNLRIYTANSRFGTGKYLHCRWNNAELRVNTVGQITDTMYVSCAVMFDNVLGTSGTDIMYWMDDDVSAINLILKMRNDGHLQFTNAAGTALHDISLRTVALKVWYYMEIKVHIHASTGTLQLKMDGADWIDETGLDTLYTGLVAIGGFRLTGGSAPYTHWDDLVWQDDAGSFMGDLRVETIMPNAAGSQSNWTIGGSAPAATRHESVDEIPHDDDVTYVLSATNTQIDLYGYETIADSDTVKCVETRVLAKKTDTGARSVQSRTYADTGNDLQGGTSNALSTSYIWYRDVFETSDGSTAWTKTLIDSAEFGVQVTV